MSSARKNHRFFTVVIVPHSDGEVVSFRLPLAVAQVLCTLVAAFWIGLLVFANSYVDMLSAMDELFALRAAHREQQERFAELSEQAAQIQAQLEQLALLDQQVRGLLAKGPFRTQAAQMAAATTAGTSDAKATQLGAGGPDTMRAGADEVTALQIELFRLNEEVEERSASLGQVLQGLEVQLEAYETTPTLWPVRGIITSGFGWRPDPITGRRDFHPGVDIAAPYGTPVVAAAGGRVTYAGWDGAYGRTVTIDHGDYVTRYGHNSRIVVEPGQVIRKGQVIAYVGSSGRSTGPHVHYEVYLKGRLMNARHFLAER